MTSPSLGAMRPAVTPLCYVSLNLIPTQQVYALLQVYQHFCISSLSLTSTYTRSFVDQCSVVEEVTRDQIEKRGYSWPPPTCDQQSTGASNITIQNVNSLKVPERYQKCLRVSFSVKGNPLSAPPSGRDWATNQKANIGGDRKNPGIRILPLPRANSLLGGRLSGQIRTTSCPQDGKLYLKADEPQIDQRHEDVERKREYYHIIIFPERT